MERSSADVARGGIGCRIFLMGNIIHILTVYYMVAPQLKTHNVRDNNAITLKGSAPTTFIFKLSTMN
ncbi:hypothetical protein DAPPUDRAFT_233051 [Daphnia pulex]|uniref:Uncharacterized protein n=1 Tax=Daphnia pulex TaxID=6669 RepID=E9FT19_DAPPU|nr:hypothetical protein DAPPUDRAFT_233051 [Daphnia pulex]|eukprot:EFX89294.1 hypothetical protein DAPPUDRAFT_233051 [Daphnia pulex]